jgi:hypothetical protein
MRKRGTIAALAGAVLALGAGTADAAVLPDLTSATRGDLNQAAPDFTNRQIKRAAIRAIESGAKPRKLRRSSPAWYTETKKGKKPQGEGDVTMAPVDAPLPGEIGIRPGNMMISPFICTMNFIFQKGSTLAIGTAGHCIDGNEPIVLLTLAPGGDNPVLVELGNVLLKRNGGIGKDYALVEIPPALHSWVFPTQAVVGGPCGVYSQNSPQPVAHYGHGVGIGTGGTPRAGMGFSIADPPKLIRGLDWDWDADSIVWAGAAMPGDSGSGVRIGQLPAVSNLTHGLGLGPDGIVPVPFLAWGTRVTTITSSGWQLVNSMLCPPAG